MNFIDEDPVTGVITPTITFFTAEGSIAPEANQLLLEHVIRNRANAIFVMGSTGEGRFFCDKPEEKKRYLELVKATVQPTSTPDLPILVGIYGENAPDAIMDAQATLRVIPNAMMVIPPPVGSKLNAPEQRDFFSEILDQIEAPIYAYNNPGTFGGTQLDVKIMEGLKSYPHFKGLKDSSGSTDQKKEYLQLVSRSFTVSCGKEGMLAQFLALVPQSDRKLIGIVPSIANLTQTCAEIVAQGNLGNDKLMLDKQAMMNQYREKIYDAAQEKGKAQRGLKIAFAHLYRDRGIEIPVTVSPGFKRDVADLERKAIQKQTDELLANGEILKVD
jgi:hypothetical protein